MSNIDFLAAYNRLDLYLKKILGISKKINLISDFEKVLPEKKSAELYTIRQFKNIVESHGVFPKNVQPEAPIEWTNWLINALDYVKHNEEFFKKELEAVLNDKQNNKKEFNKCKSCEFYDGKKCVNYGYFIGNKEIFNPTDYAIKTKSVIKRIKPCIKKN